MSRTRPNFAQYVPYAYGLRRLPDSLRTWVARDLAGPGATRRVLVVFAIPPLLVLAPFWLLPASLYVHTEMTVPIFIWAVLITLAMNKVWRRHRLAQHGLDPNLVDVLRRKKDAKMHEDYARRFGERPESAEWQENSNPFF
ncbi:MAG: DUF5313 domain-containing protein [Mycobacterium sp.]